MDALAAECVEVGGSRGHKGLAFTRAHFRDVAHVQGGAAHELHVEVAHAKGAVRCFADGGKRLREQVVQRFAIGDSRPEFICLAAQLGIAKGTEFAIKHVDSVSVSTQLFQRLLIAGTQDTFKH